MGAHPREIEGGFGSWQVGPSGLLQSAGHCHLGKSTCNSLVNRIWEGSASAKVDEEDADLLILEASTERLMSRGWRHLCDRRPQEAAADFGKVISQHPDCAAAHNNRGIALEILGQRVEAQRHYEEADRLAALATDADLQRSLWLTRKWKPIGWQAKGEPEAETTAAEADFLLSFATPDAKENNRILTALCDGVRFGDTIRPWASKGRVFFPPSFFSTLLCRGRVTFCHDRSLGMGLHVVDGQARGRHDPKFADLDEDLQTQLSSMSPEPVAWFQGWVIVYNFQERQVGEFPRWPLGPPVLMQGLGGHCFLYSPFFVLEITTPASSSKTLNVFTSASALVSPNEIVSRFVSLSGIRSKWPSCAFEVRTLPTGGRGHEARDPPSAADGGLLQVQGPVIGVLLCCRKGVEARGSELKGSLRTGSRRSKACRWEFGYLRKPELVHVFVWDIQGPRIVSWKDGPN